MLGAGEKMLPTLDLQMCGFLFSNVLYDKTTEPGFCWRFFSEGFVGFYCKGRVVKAIIEVY